MYGQNTETMINREEEIGTIMVGLKFNDDNPYDTLHILSVLLATS